VASGGGVGLLKVERRGELREEETRGLTADLAVAPLVIELECMDVLRRGGALWSADDILWVTLGTLYTWRHLPHLLVTCTSTAHPS
jgi:hypothetical protein